MQTADLDSIHRKENEATAAESAGIFCTLHSVCILARLTTFLQTFERHFPCFITYHVKCRFSLGLLCRSWQVLGCPGSFCLQLFWLHSLCSAALTAVTLSTSKCHLVHFFNNTSGCSKVIVSIKWYWFLRKSCNWSGSRQSSISVHTVYYNLLVYSLYSTCK